MGPTTAVVWTQQQCDTGTHHCRRLCKMHQIDQFTAEAGASANGTSLFGHLPISFLTLRPWRILLISPKQVGFFEAARMSAPVNNVNIKLQNKLKLTIKGKMHTSDRHTTEPCELSGQESTSGTTASCHARPQIQLVATMSHIRDLPFEFK